MPQKELAFFLEACSQQKMKHLHWLMFLNQPLPLDEFYEKLEEKKKRLQLSESTIAKINAIHGQDIFSQ